MAGRLGYRIDVVKRLKRKTIYQDACWLFTGKLTYGYGNIWYNNKMVRVGRLSCHLYHNADLNDPKWTANHKDECPNRNCWNPDHLYVGNSKQNVADQIRKGTFHYGTKNLNFRGNYAWLKRVE